MYDLLLLQKISVIPLAIRLADTVCLSNRLNASEQRELQTRLEKKQMKEFMTVSICSC